MSRNQFFRTLVVAGMLSLGTASIPAKAETPNLGEPVDTSTAMANSVTVFPDGKGLPAGSGSATEGKLVYEQHCQACHGPNGNDGINDALVGGVKSIGSTKPRRTVGSYWPYATTLFDYVRRAMPYNSPGSLSAEETYAVTAYILKLNGIIAGDRELTQASLPQIVMPNRSGFDWQVTATPANDG